MEEGDVLVAARLGVRDPRQAEELEPHGVAPLAPVHVVAEGQDDLQHPLQPLAPLHLLGTLEHRLD